MEKRRDSLTKILVIVKSIDGGTGTFVLTFLKLLNYFPKNSLQIKVLVLEKPSFRKIKNNDLIIMRTPSFYPQKYSFSPLNIFYFFQELISIKKLIKYYDPNIVMGVDMRCNCLVSITKIVNIKKIKTIATTHIDLSSLTLNRANPISKMFFKIFVKLLYELVDIHVSVSKNLATNLKEDFNISKKINIIYNGLNLNITKPKILKSDKDFIITTIARLSIQKDHETLIRAFDLMRKKLPNTKLWITSDGPEKHNLLKLTKDLKLFNKVRFLGWIKNINEVLKKSDLFILSSKSEGFGFVLIEAMSKGLPVVSTNTPYGPEEVLDYGKYGILTPVGDEKLMANKIIKLLTNQKIYLHYSKQSIARSKYFSEEKMLNGYKDLITKLSK
jgi:glycosyltransferase involved in cell wall biosynthesis